MTDKTNLFIEESKMVVRLNYSNMGGRLMAELLVLVEGCTLQYRSLKPSQCEAEKARLKGQWPGGQAGELDPLSQATRPDDSGMYLIRD